MRRFLVFAALLGLTACGGPMTPEEEQALSGSQSVASGQVEGQAIGICNPSSPDCYCGQYRDQTRCMQARTPSGVSCTWNYDNRCVAGFW